MYFGFTRILFFKYYFVTIFVITFMWYANANGSKELKSKLSLPESVEQLYKVYRHIVAANYSGFQRQSTGGVVNADLVTVQGVLEDALRSCTPSIAPIVKPSSRTDAGVHALLTTATVDLDLNAWQLEKLFLILRGLNKYFSKTGYNIRAQYLKEVPSDFSARYRPIRRSYLYRFAVRNAETTNHMLTTHKHNLPYPVTEENRCFFVRNPVFNEKEVQKAAKLFVGTQDCIALMSHRGVVEGKDTVRTVEKCELTPGRPLLPSSLDRYYTYWEIHCTSKSFLYRQVRRTVGALLAVGQGRWTLFDIEKLFIEPAKENWTGKAITVPAHGLYLANIEFNPTDLVVPGETGFLNDSAELDYASERMAFSKIS